MSNLVSIQTALSLPAPDVEALIQGRIIAAMPRLFLNPGRQFALYPADVTINLPSHEQHYRSSFLPIAQTALAHLGSETVLIKAWARCELCQMLNDPESIKALSRLTIWTTEALQQTLLQRSHIFLAHLRVYLLPQPIEIAVHTQERQFMPLPYSLSVTESSPVLSDRLFTQRRHQLENRLPPLHPELEELQSAIAPLASTYPDAKELDRDIRIFLGWAEDLPLIQRDPNLLWIKTIAALGDRSIELDERKSNYQAGTDFENIARQSLEFLRFKVENAYKGGAGGLDLFCSKPYPLVVECKAGKLIPSGTVEELIKLGGMHLGTGQFLESAKLVIGPGKPSTDMLTAAQAWQVSMINAMTLQKLIELKAKYPGSVNLIALKEYLKPGQIDYKIDEYIEKVEGEIKLRSHLIQLVKKQIENTGDENVSIDSIHGAYAFSNPAQPLKREAMHEILIELSSPLTGYLGRVKGSDWKSDRFYFLRDLQVD